MDRMELRARLEGERDAIAGELGRPGRGAGHLAGDPLDDPLDQNAAQVLMDVDAALARLDDGYYGLCTACGETIAPARLAGLPHAATCIDCQRAGERADEAA